MVLKNGKVGINGGGHRRLVSWIDAFVEHTANIESDEIFRRWAAITVLAATLEQKVWVKNTAITYPHLYTFLVGHAGIGKSWAISSAVNIMRELPEAHISPTSMTMASLVDHLVSSKRTIIVMPDPAIEYNSSFIVASELSAFMHEYVNDIIAGLTTFYDVEPYGQERRVGSLKIKIARPQVNLLSGTTPSNLMKFIPEYAWEQGFTSRIILIYGKEKPIVDLWNAPTTKPPEDLIHDLQLINSLMGQFGWTEEFAGYMHKWKLAGFTPVPNHPKLRWYCERRERHITKLAMISAVDRGNKLELTKADFNRAMNWLVDAERRMPDIFSSGAGGIDARAMDEIAHFVKKMGRVSEPRVVRFAREYIPAYNIMKVLEMMEKSGDIKCIGIDKFGLREFSASD